MSTHLRFAPEILIRLGEELIPHPDLGVIELVRNAYDADAKRCVVRLHNASQPGGTLVVEDDGDGMTAEDIREGFLLIGKSTKSGSPNTRSSRRRIGEKGLGRLAALRLGRRVELVSRPRGEPGVEHTLVIDWSDYDSVRSVEEVELTVVSEPTRRSPGTSVTVHRLRQGFDNEQMERLARAMRLLTGFFDDEVTDFTASLIAPHFDRVSDAVNRSFFDEFEYKLEAHIDEQGFASTVLYDWKGQVITRGEHIDVAPEGPGGRLQSPLRYQAPPASFELWMFLLNKRSFDLRHSSRRYTDLRPWLRVVGGVHLFHRGLRVHPYGDPGSDWLDLNLLRARSPELRPSTNTSVGRVSVEDPDGLLVPKTDRMGFQENAAFIELRQFARSATDWAARERKRIRNNEEAGSHPSAQRRELKPARERSEVPKKLVETEDAPEMLPLADLAVHAPRPINDQEDLILPTVPRERLLYRALATIGILATEFSRERVGFPNESGGVIGSAEFGRLAASVTRSDKLQIEVINLNEVTASALRVLRAPLDRLGVLIEEDLWDGPLYVAGSVSDLEVILFSLTASSMSFFRTGGAVNDQTILVRTHVDGIHAVMELSNSNQGIADVNVVEMRPGLATDNYEPFGSELMIVRDAVADMCGMRSMVGSDALMARATGLGSASFRIRLPVRRVSV
ncbi:ATP-binding protein [Kitasatospora sp. NPDC094015]|uniref:ATP-binding protein n=1 Tax=Kitasatospora sp. NPDC094015 TaxID=3155205 RepID=UPI00331B56C9